MKVIIGKYIAESDKDRWDLIHVEERDVTDNKTGITEKKEVTTQIGFSYMDMDSVVKQIIKLEVGKSNLITDLRGWLTEYERVKFKTIPVFDSPE